MPGAFHIPVGGGPLVPKGGSGHGCQRVRFQLNSKKKSNRQTIFNFAESRRKKREKRRSTKPKARVRVMLTRRVGERGDGLAPTSRTAFAVDAWARQSDEGRGDRRNVQGELHASEEP